MPADEAANYISHLVKLDFLALQLRSESKPHCVTNP